MYFISPDFRLSQATFQCATAHSGEMFGDDRTERTIHTARKRIDTPFAALSEGATTF